MSTRPPRPSGVASGYTTNNADPFSEALCASRTLDPLRTLTEWFDINDDLTTPIKALTTLFDSTDPADHAEAAKLCAACPLAGEYGACKARLDDVASASVAAESGYHGPEGTWAGLLLAPSQAAKEGDTAA